jgi:hypothetical protein
MRLKGLALAALLLAAAPAVAQAQAPPPPPNDNYLESLRLNDPGTRVDRQGLRDQQDTTSATEQGDLFNPGPGGGPPETLTCRARSGFVSSFGKTIWYDVYPDVPGLLHVSTVGTFDSVISIVPFGRDAIPDYSLQQCNDSDSGPTEELFATIGPISGGWTMQIGGYNAGGGAAGGPVQTTFEFFPDTDGDGTLDGTDKCPTRPGDVNGCPRRLDRTVRVPYRWNVAPGGILLRSMKVDAPRGARIAVTCSRRACRRISRRATVMEKPVGPVGLAAAKRKSSGGPLARTAKADPQAYVARTIRLITNKRFRAGTRIDVKVTMPTAIGALIRHTVGNGTFKQTRYCLEPGSSRPRKRCR